MIFQTNTIVAFPLSPHWGIPTSGGTHFLIRSFKPIDHPVNPDLAHLFQSTLCYISACSDHFVLTQMTSYCCCIKLLYTLARLVPRDGVCARMVGKGIKCWTLMTCIGTAATMAALIIMQRKTHRNNFVASQLLCKIQVNCASRHTNTFKQTHTSTYTLHCLWAWLVQKWKWDWVIRAQGEDIPSSSPADDDDGKGLSQRSAPPPLAVMADDITY